MPSSVGVLWIVRWRCLSERYLRAVDMLPVLPVLPVMMVLRLWIISPVLQVVATGSVLVTMAVSR